MARRCSPQVRSSPHPPAAQADDSSAAHSQPAAQVRNKRQALLFTPVSSSSQTAASVRDENLPTRERLAVEQTGDRNEPGSTEAFCEESDGPLSYYLSSTLYSDYLSGTLYSDGLGVVFEVGFAVGGEREHGAGVSNPRTALFPINSVEASLMG